SAGLSDPQATRSNKRPVRMSIDAGLYDLLHRFLQNFRSQKFPDLAARHGARLRAVDRCPEPDAWFALDGEHVAHLDRCDECRAVAALIVRAGVLGETDGEGGLVPELLPSGARLGRYV